MEEGVQGTVDMMNEFNRINERFAEPMSDEEMAELCERQAEVQEKLDAQDAWDLDSRLEMAMDALRCPPPETNTETLSEAKSAGLPCVASSSSSRTSSFWTSPPTTWTPSLWPGWSITFRDIPAPSSQ